MFDGWRVLALGITQIGEQVHTDLHFLTGFLGPLVQFFGIVMLTPQIRAVDKSYTWRRSTCPS